MPMPTMVRSKIKLTTPEAAALANPDTDIINMEEIDTTRRPYLSASGPASNAPHISPAKTADTMRSPVDELKSQ